MIKRTCSIDGCDLPAKGTYCQGHSKRKNDGREMNTPIKESSPHDLPLRDRFFARVDTSAGRDACWPWMGATRAEQGKRKRNVGRYGKMGYKGKTWYTHRLSFYLHYGYEPQRPQQIRHLCGNPSCCNPRHLMAGTASENIQDAVRAGTHYSYFRECAEGLHPWPRTSR